MNHKGLTELIFFFKTQFLKVTQFIRIANFLSSKKAPILQHKLRHCIQAWWCVITESQKHFLYRKHILVFNFP